MKPEEEGEHVSPIRLIPHYHGDRTRMLFVVSAILLFFAESTGAILPLTPAQTVVSAIVLVVAAGVTNPRQSSIHWFNALLAVLGVVTFGPVAIAHDGAPVDASFLYHVALTMLSLVALYFSVRTIRGFHLRPRLS